MPDGKGRTATTLRFDPALRARLDEFATATHRTLHGAVTQLLTEALDARDRTREGKPHN